jgi:threonylcarbamoyladenosine tRNA methylthiotransferase MtaB
MTRVYATFVGCKVSQADSRVALRALQAAGHEPVDDPAQADLHVLMTCAVTAEAERKSRRLARRLAASGRPVLVAGCAGALRAGQFEGEGVTVVSGDDAQAALQAVVAGAEQALAGSAPPASAPPASAPPEVGQAAAAPSRRTRFTLKVQDGCASSCTYCAVRLARGRPWSSSAAAAVAEVAEALAAGCGEVVLSGVNLGRYRDDEAGDELAELIARLTSLPGLARLRLSSIEPLDITPALIEALAHPKVARHLHVPLQSADDDVLAAMGRPYTFAQFRDRLAAARERLDDLAVTTDIIVGFPTEGDEAFARTLAAITPSDGLFTRVHVFRYSSRPGTAAGDLQPLSPVVVKERMARALTSAEGARRAAAAAWLGRSATVIVEEYRDGLSRGYSSQYVRYYLEGESAPGALVSAVADELHADGVKGRLL